jgi:hypothetical protein
MLGVVSQPSPSIRCAEALAWRRSYEKIDRITDQMLYERVTVLAKIAPQPAAWNIDSVYGRAVPINFARGDASAACECQAKVANSRAGKKASKAEYSFLGYAAGEEIRIKLG